LAITFACTLLLATNACGGPTSDTPIEPPPPPATAVTTHVGALAATDTAGAPEGRFAIPNRPLILNFKRPMDLVIDGVLYASEVPSMTACMPPGVTPAQFTTDGRKGGGQPVVFSGRWRNIVSVSLYLSAVTDHYCSAGDWPPPVYTTGQRLLIDAVDVYGNVQSTGGYNNIPASVPSGQPGWSDWSDKQEIKIVRFEVNGKPYHVDTMDYWGTRPVPAWTGGARLYVGEVPIRDALSSSLGGVPPGASPVFAFGGRDDPTTFPVETGPFEWVAAPTPRASLGLPAYRATLAPQTPETPLLSENRVPMTAMVINAGTHPGGRPPHHVAQAAIIANPSIQFLVPTQNRFTDVSDPRFADEQRRIASILGVPAQNVMPIRSDMALFPQDEFTLGVIGGRPTVGKQLGSSDEGGVPLNDTYAWKPGIAVQAGSIPPHWNDSLRTQFAANDLASELQIGVGAGPAIGRGGDSQILTRQDGTQAVLFSRETIAYAGRSRGLDVGLESNFLRALNVAMVSFRNAGIPIANQAPIGFSQSGKTYAQALATLTDAERRALDPQVHARLVQMGAMMLPETAYEYHTDVTVFSPDGRRAFISERNPWTDRPHTDLPEQLRFFGYEVRTLPSPRLGTSSRSTNYMNMVTGLDVAGQPIVLMPTEAESPTQLTANDQRVLQALREAMPGGRIIPVGGATAVHTLSRDYGFHCQTNVVPLIVAPR
jgi:hypothetical protein